MITDIIDSVCSPTSFFPFQSIVLLCQAKMLFSSSQDRAIMTAVTSRYTLSIHQGHHDSLTIPTLQIRSV